MNWVVPLATTAVQGLLGADFAAGDTFKESAKIFGKSAMKSLQVGAFGLNISKSVLQVGKSYYQTESTKNQAEISENQTVQGALSSVGTDTGKLTETSVKASSSTFAALLDTILKNGKAMSWSPR
ncbi:MAG: hypothetical protein SP1CHLAM54_17630 [Chlamydiia bacterium]|nr:hypothetical protein [Chlamydiia bacterium]MCH9616651.1 hypothetical protein [Chlamydiia bacterium]MCH9629381.1 hypothetical protein [Chlamydiia bacterium]